MNKYTISKHVGFEPYTLYNMDSRDAMSAVPQGSFNFILASPPYVGQRGATSDWVDYISQMSNIYRYAYNRLADDGCVASVVRSKRTNDNWFDMNLFFAWENIYQASRLNMLNVMIWKKLNPVPVGDLRSKPLDIPAWEVIFVGTKANSPREAKSRAGQREYAEKTKTKASSGNMRGNGRYSGGHAKLNDHAMGFDVIEAATADGKNRPVAKGGSFSIGLAKQLIYRFSDEGDLVADIFAGVSTTGKACQVMNRRYWGCDKNEEDLQKGSDWLNDYGQGRLAI